MKTVVKGEELKSVILKSIELLCDTVESTLGPLGNNVIINSDTSSPFITNDGVTIASNIESDDIKVNTLLELIKEASLKTNEMVGDGTTTTLVLLKSIIIDGLKEIENGISPITIKNELNKSLESVIDKLMAIKRVPTKDDILSIATISSESEEIGKIVSEAFDRVNGANAIKLEEGSSNQTYCELKKGYTVSIDNLPSIYFKDNNQIELKDVNILLIKGYLSNLEQISSVINEYLENDKNLVILSTDFDNHIYEQMVLYYLNNKNIYLFKVEDYTSGLDRTFDDISEITNSKIKNIDYEEIDYKNLGKAESISFTSSELSIINKSDNEKYIDKLKEELSNTKSSFEKDILKERIAKLDNGILTISVGGNTKLEIREKLMRYEDAINAVEIAKSGVVPGEGIAFLTISRDLKDTIGDRLLKNALDKPFKKIIENNGLDYNEFKNKIEESNYNLIYNFDKKIFENISKTKIIDPVLVLKEALINAVSISSIILSTSYMVIRETQQENEL